jgi:hypothetical protein
MIYPTPILYLSNTHICLSVRSEGVKKGKSMSSIFPTESVPDLPNNTDIELAVTTRFGNRIGDFDQNKKTLSQFL